MGFQIHPQLAKDSLLLGTFELCQLRLINDSQYPWFVLVPKRENLQEIYQLGSEQMSFWQESAHLSEVLMKHFTGDKLNVAAIGNMVPQLHIHHIVRFKTDPCWPKPVWGQLPMKAYEDQYVLLLQKQLSLHLDNFKQCLNFVEE